MYLSHKNKVINITLRQTQYFIMEIHFIFKPMQRSCNIIKSLTSA